MTTLMRRPRVLCVDDEPSSRAIVARKIEALADVVEAEDGFDALAHMQSASFDLVLVDLDMPHFGGLDLLAAVRGHPILRHVPMIVLTGNDTRDALETALAAGATSFLLKPLNWRMFGPHIQHILELAYRSGHVATHDALTQLPNRSLFNERLKQAWDEKREPALVTVLALDLDRFKEVNDQFGHAAGDELLDAAAHRLRSIVRSADTISRIGGDEFAILQPTVEEPRDAELLAQRVISELGRPFVVQGHEINIGATIGIAVSSADVNSSDALLRNADLALCRAKIQGKGSYQFFDAAMGLERRRQRMIHRDLRKALAGNQFELVYQPILDNACKAICGFEALLRWNHPSLGVIPPGTFIAIAEEDGLIEPITAWILREACATAARWPANIKIAINISALHLRKSDFRDLVVGTLRETGLPADRLELEITETAILTEDLSTIDHLSRLRKLGVHVVADDFGTGYSSLTNLQNFAFDKVKIDRSFVKRCPADANAVNIVRAIAKLARQLGIITTAEGVETNEQMASMIRSGCSQTQGFLVGRPIAATEVARFLTQHVTPTDRIFAPNGQVSHVA